MARFVGVQGEERLPHKSKHNPKVRTSILNGIASPDIAIVMSRMNSIMIFLESEPLDRKIAAEMDSYRVTTVV